MRCRFALIPVLRARLNEKFNRSAENHAFLVETVSGIDTVKAMAVEPRWIQQWEKQLAAYVSSGLRATLTAQVASTGVTLVSKLVTLAITWAGAYTPCRAARTWWSHRHDVARG